MESSSSVIDPQICPLCNQANTCEVAAGKNTCWCFSEVISEGVAAQIPIAARGIACICQACLRLVSSSPDRIAVVP